jgi:hypothetical protein
MRKVDLRLGRDLVMTMLGLTLFFAALMCLLTAVEMTGFGAIPGQVAKGMPLLFALATVRVALRWKTSGRVIALASVGIAPIRMAAVAIGAGLVSGALVLGVVAVLPRDSELRRQWVFIGEDWALSGDQQGNTIVDLRVARLEKGTVRASGRAGHARWGGRWELEEASGFEWGWAARPMQWDLPEPDAVAKAMRRPAAVRVTGWLLALVGGALLSGLCMSLALRDRPALGLLAAVSWVFSSSVAGALVASGAASASAAVGLLLLCLIALGTYESWTTA